MNVMRQGNVPSQRGALARAVSSSERFLNWLAWSSLAASINGTKASRRFPGCVGGGDLRSEPQPACPLRSISPTQFGAGCNCSRCVGPTGAESRFVAKTSGPPGLETRKHPSVSQSGRLMRKSPAGHGSFGPTQYRFSTPRMNMAAPVNAGVATDSSPSLPSPTPTNSRDARKTCIVPPLSMA